MAKHFRFVTKDGDGQEHILTLVIDEIDVTTHDGPRNETIDGVKRIRTEDGSNVNRVSQGEYRVVGSGLLLYFSHYIDSYGDGVSPL